jgi:hypothetical protein
MHGAWRLLSVTALIGLLAACGGAPVEPGNDGGGGAGGGGNDGGGGGNDGGGGGNDGGGASNAVPVMGALASVTLSEGQTQTFTVAATDADGDSLTFSLSGAPPWITLAGTTVTLSPGFSDAGTIALTVSVSDGKGGTATGTVSISVTNVNRSPSLAALSPVTLAENATQSVSVSASDPDGDAVVIQIAGTKPAWVSVSGTSVVLAPTYADSGSYTLTVQASDPSDLKATSSLLVTVTHVNAPPALGTLTAVTMAEGGTQVVGLTATDLDGDALTYSLQSPPGWAALSGSTLTLTPSFTDSGSHSISIKVSDPSNASSSGALAVTVTNVNRTPSLSSITNVTMTEGQSQSVNLSATDPDGDTLVYSATGLPAWASLSGNTITLAPAIGNAGSVSITATATDSGSLFDSKGFTVTVLAANAPPTLSGLTQVDPGGNTVANGASVNLPPSLRATIDDPENALVKLEGEVVLASATFSNVANTVTTLSSEGTLTAQVASLPPGNYKWQVRAVDATGLPSAWTPFDSGAIAFVVQLQALNGTSRSTPPRRPPTVAP